MTRTRAILGELIGFPTVSADSNLALIEHLANLLADAGARVDVFRDTSGTKANLFATIGPDIDGRHPAVGSFRMLCRWQIKTGRPTLG